MKKTWFFLFLFFAVIFMNSCNDNSTDNPQSGNYKIYYTYITDDGKTPNVYQINVDGTNNSLLKDSSILFSKPQNGKFAFIEVDKSLKLQTLKISNTNGTNETEILITDNSIRSALISPKGDKLIYILFKRAQTLGYNSELHICNLNGSDDNIIVTNTVQSDDLGMEAAFSPDGNSIAYIDFSSENAEYINVCDINGKNRRKINQTPFDIASSFSFQTFNWSPDGRDIAVITWIEATRAVSITILNVANGLSENIYTVTNYLGKPVWSPDGKKIAFLAGPCNLWVIDRNTKQTLQLTDLTGITNDIGTLSPQWSPDGKYIIFEYTINENGGDMFEGNLTLVEFLTGTVTTLIQEEQVATAFFGW